MPVTERSQTTHSFLLDANENLSDLSSELSVDIINYSDVIARNPSPLLAAPGTAVSGLEIPTHPLAHPPSPSFTLHRLTSPHTVNPIMFQKPPLTPPHKRALYRIARPPSRKKLTVRRSYFIGCQSMTTRQPMKSLRPPPMKPMRLQPDEGRPYDGGH